MPFTVKLSYRDAEIGFEETPSSASGREASLAEVLTLTTEGILPEGFEPERRAASLSSSESNLTCIQSPQAALQKGHWSNSPLPDIWLHPIQHQIPIITNTLGIYCF